MISVAIIGGGYIGDCHVAAYGKMDTSFVKVSAVVDANPKAGQAMAEKAGCKWYPTLEEAVQTEDVDVVDICVPTFLHDMFAIKAAQMGKHVLCEKPVTLSLEQFDRMEQACRENGVKFMTAQVVRYMPVFAEAARRMQAGQLGDVHMLSEKRLCQHPLWTSWHRDPAKSGGGLFDLNTHDIDFIYSLFGLPQSISSVGWKNETGCWNHVAQVLRWEDKQAVCETSLEMTGDFPFTEELRITGDAGTLDYKSSAGVNIKDGQAIRSFVHYPVGNVPEEVETGEYDPFQVMIEGFLRAVAEDTAVPIPPSQTRDVVRILEASQKSLETGKTVYLEDAQ